MDTAVQPLVFWGGRRIDDVIGSGRCDIAARCWRCPLLRRTMTYSEKANLFRALASHISEAGSKKYASKYCLGWRRGGVGVERVGEWLSAGGWAAYL